MPLIFRAMLADDSVPVVGPSRKMLGVTAGHEPNVDITPTVDGLVIPESGGMSVAPAWTDLPAHRIPRRLRDKCESAAGNNNRECWRLGSGAFNNSMVSSKLNLRVDSRIHGVVEPSREMSLSDFQDALAQTRQQWTIDPETVRSEV